MVAVSHKLRRASERLRTALLDFAFPPTCPICRAAVADDSESVVTFCESCRGQLTHTILHACDICGAPVGQYVDSSNGCMECGLGKKHYRRVIRLGLYNGVLRKACIKAKDDHQEPLMASLGRLLVEDQADHFFDPRPDVLIPLPQHWSSRWSSKHNAAEILARVLGKMLQLKVDPNLLGRSRKTKPQKRTESIAARKENQRDSFRVTDDATLKGRRVMLVDDILTTGATANEAAKCLKRAGADVIGIAVIARVLSKQLKNS